MNITDLRSALRDRAGELEEYDAVERAAQVHARVRRSRRRRIAGVGALTVGALVLVAAVTALPRRGAEPAGVDHPHFVSHSGEFDLIAATVGAPGENTLDLDVPAHQGELYVTMACFGANGAAEGYWVSGYAGEARPDRPHSTWCGGDPDTPVVPSVRGDAPGPWQYDPGLQFVVDDDEVTIHVELTKEVDKNGVPLSHADEIGTYVRTTNPDAWLGIAVYSVADPVAEIAGTKIRPLVGVNGKDYAYVAARQTSPGAQKITWTVDPSTVERYYDVVAENIMDPNTVESDISVDMSLDSESCRIGYAAPRFRTGGCLLSPGKPHTITASIAGDVPMDAVMGIVLYRAS